MAISSVIPPDWLRALTDAATVILLLELMVLLVILVALAFALAFAMRWLQMHLVPVLNATVPAANQALEVANQGSDRVVRGVAEVYGIRRGLETALQVLLFGRVPPQAAASARGQGATPPTQAPTSLTQGVATSTRDVPPQPSAGRRADRATRPPQPQQPPQQVPPPTGRAPQGRDLSGMAPHAG